jgi:DNA modification methylase
MNKSTTMIEPGQVLSAKVSPPADVHWRELYDLPFFGEIYDVENDKYYHRKCGRTYRPKIDKTNKHLDEGHFQGFSYAISKFTKPGDVVFDPFVGTGTAIIESLLQNRRGVGIELEYPDIARKNIEFLERDNYLLYEGDSRKVLKNEKIEKLDLIVTGPPYPTKTKGAPSSDAPLEVKDNKIGAGGDYYHSESIGKSILNKGYIEDLMEVLNPSWKLLKKGGHFITIIKDMVNNKAPWMLQQYINDEFMKQNPDAKLKGWFCHSHFPPTMFMSTYNKRFPEVLIPKYQIGLILEKI